MKKSDVLKATFIFSFFWIMILLHISAFGQQEVIRETRDLPAFDQIDAGGAFEVMLTIGEPQKVEVEAKQKVIGKISTEVRNNKLHLSSDGNMGNSPLRVTITMPAISRIDAHGAANIKGVNTIKSDMLAIDASGAAQIRLDLDVNTLRSDISGAASLDLSGKAQQHSTVVSGAATLNAKKLVTATTDADVSGAGTANVNAGNVTGKTSGAGNINTEEGEWESEGSDDVIVRSDEDGDTTYVHIPGTGVEITEGDDSVKVKVGNRIIIIDDDGEIKTRHCHEPKFNGHWAGVDIGLNG